MEIKLKNIFFGIMLILLIVNVSAADILKPAKLNQTYTIIQTCASCTFVNITISNVDGILVSNQNMTDNSSGIWIFDIIPTLASRHDITGMGDLDGTDTSFVTFFEVTPSGKVASTGDSILYVLFSFIFFMIILTLTFFVFSMPNKNESVAGQETKIIKMKYIRFVFMFLIYPLIILLLNFLNGLANNFTALSMFSGIFGFLFKVMLSLAWIYTLVMIVWLIVMAVHDTNVNKQLKKIYNTDLFRQ